MFRRVFQEQVTDNATIAMFLHLVLLNTTMYQRVVTIPVLDHLISEMNSRFNSQLSSLVTEVMQLLPPQIVKRDSATTPNELTEFRAVYGDILPSLLSLDTELHCW